MTEFNPDIVTALNHSLEIKLPGEITYEELKEKLSVHINHLIENNFQKLVSLLYRIDISEPKLKALLKEHPDADAGKIIADLIIERQLQKIKTRQQFSRRDNDIDENEKW